VDAVVDVGFVGPGLQGYGMAEMLRRSPYRLHMWARNPQTLHRFTDDVTVVRSKAELAARCDLIGVCVRTEADVEEVLAGPHGLIAGMRPGSIVAIHSTVSPQLCVQMSVLAARSEVIVLDAPVSGSTEAALARQLTVFVGGTQEAFDLARPAFETFGDPVRLVGPLGAGQIFKLMNNLLFMTNLSAAIETLAACDALGLDVGVVEELLAVSSGRSEALVHWCTTITPQILDHVTGLLAKDLALATAMAAGRSVDVSGLTATAERGLQRMRSSGRPGAFGDRPDPRNGVET
jgi:3-hydroxyisobutyrate dehydrogenase